MPLIRTIIQGSRLTAAIGGMPVCNTVDLWKNHGTKGEKEEIRYGNSLVLWQTEEAMHSDAEARVAGMSPRRGRTGIVPLHVRRAVLYVRCSIAGVC